MLKTCMSVMGVMALLLTATPSNAAEESGRIVKAVFFSDTGEKAEFNAEEGGALLITHMGTNIEYRLATAITDGKVQFKIYDVASEVLLDTLVMSQNGKVVRSTVVPFSFSVQGIEEAGQAPAPEQLQSGGDLPTTLAKRCCIVCGPYRVCCSPPRGKCCRVSSSCGNSCTVCN
jgi:hypothetical protein